MVLCHIFTSILPSYALTSNSTVSDTQLGDLFAFTVVIPGQQPVVLCTSNEKERLQWRLAFTYSIHCVYLTGSVKNQIHFMSLTQSRLRDMQFIALQIANCKNRMLILPPSFRRVDKAVAQSQAAALDAAGGAIPTTLPPASFSKLRSSSAYLTSQSPPSLIYQLAGRDVSDSGVQMDGPRQRAATAAAPISNLLQSMKPQSARPVDVVPPTRPLSPVKAEVESMPSKQHMDLRPHQVTRATRQRHVTRQRCLRRCSL